MSTPAEIAAADQALEQSRRDTIERISGQLDLLTQGIRRWRARHEADDPECGNPYCFPADYIDYFHDMDWNEAALLVRVAIQRILDHEKQL